MTMNMIPALLPVQAVLARSRARVTSGPIRCHTRANSLGRLGTQTTLTLLGSADNRHWTLSARTSD